MYLGILKDFLFLKFSWFRLALAIIVMAYFTLPIYFIVKVMKSPRLNWLEKTLYSVLILVVFAIILSGLGLIAEKSINQHMNSAASF